MAANPTSQPDRQSEALDGFNSDVLVDELLRREAITPEVANAIRQDAALYTEGQAVEIFGSEYSDFGPPSDIDSTELEEARAELMSGRRGEALIHLERALGGDFVGRLAIA